MAHRSRRYGAIYLVHVLDPRTGEYISWGYVGKTSDVEARIAEHMRDQPWGDTIVNWEIVWHGQCTRLGLWAREIFWIKRVRPMHNYEWNRSNPRRVPIYLSRDLARRGYRTAAFCAAKVALAADGGLRVPIRGPRRRWTR